MNFKKALILFFAACLLIFALAFFIQLSLWWLLVPIVFLKTSIIWGAATIQSQFFGKSHFKGQSTAKEFAITFDDGPNADFTPKVLALLKKFNASATFFVIGKNINGNEKILQQIDTEGHTIGNHSYSHSFFIDFKWSTGFKEELNDCNQLVQNAIGKQMKFFRPPYGVTTPHLVSAAKQLNYEIIAWNVRSFDTKNEEVSTIVNRVKKQLSANSILLLHDTSDKSITVLEQTLSFAKENGFKIVSIEKLLNLKAYH
jgi:peptidoglycan-N-acetylglucosamine deacetylase